MTKPPLLKLVVITNKMIYCTTCARRYNLEMDSYFRIGLAQCEICGGGGAPYHQKWIGIDKIVDIGVRRNLCRKLNERVDKIQ